MELTLKAGEFYGRTSHALLASGFRFTEKIYSSRATLPRHAHELPHFCFVLTGNYQENIGGRTFARRPATLVFYPPDVSHGEEHFAKGRHFLVEIDLTGLQRVKEYGARLGEPVLLVGSSSIWLAARMYREFSERDTFSPLILESISTELLIAASRKELPTSERKPPSWLRSIKECLRETLAEPPDLKELGEAVNIHPTHIARVFRQFEHCTVGDYIREVRINYARQRMLESNDTLVEIALAAGFADQTHFTRSFKRVTGMTPREFRRMFATR